jgi:hypothetical protein
MVAAFWALQLWPVLTADMDGTGGGEEGDQVQSPGEKVERIVVLHGFLVILVEASRDIEPM